MAARGGEADLTPRIENQYPLFTRATGRKLMGVVAAGPHNLGPHYWLGFATAFMLGELAGDAAAAEAAWGTPGKATSPPFGEVRARARRGGRESEWLTRDFDAMEGRRPVVTFVPCEIFH